MFPEKKQTCEQIVPCQVFKNITLCARENFENFLDRFSTLTNFAHTHTPLWPPDLNGGRKVGKFCSKNNFPTNDRVCVCVCGLCWVRIFISLHNLGFCNNFFTFRSVGGTREKYHSKLHTETQQQQHKSTAISI